MAEKIREAEVQRTLDRLVEEGLSPEFVQQCRAWWHLKAEVFPEVYDAEAYSPKPTEKEPPASLTTALLRSKYLTSLSPKTFDSVPLLVERIQKVVSQMPPPVWDYAGNKSNPDAHPEFCPGIKAELQSITPQESILSHFSFPDFVEWYSRFFLRQIKEVKLPEAVVQSMKKMEYALRGVAPQDPTIYPLIENSLGVTCRTTRSEGGELLLIEALLPQAPGIKIVVKKVPPVWEELFEQELKTHKTLISLGYEREVTNPIAHQQDSRTLTYGYLAGDLSDICAQPEEVKQRELWKAIELLLPMSLDLTIAFKREQLLKELLEGKIYSEQYLSQRFLKNFFLRTALAKDGHHLREVDASVLEMAQQVLTGEADLVNEEEWLKRTTPGFKFTKPYHSEREFQDYPHLLKIATGAKSRQLYQHYRQSLALALAALPLYVGHDDFTIRNILATDIGRDSQGHLLYSGLKMHDIGLVMAPFQSYLYDLLVSANASPETCEELMQRTYRALRRGCEQRGVPVQNTYSEFREGYRLVAVDKHLHQASIKLMLQCLEEKEKEKEERKDQLLYNK